MRHQLSTGSKVLQQIRIANNSLPPPIDRPYGTGKDKIPSIMEHDEPALPATAGTEELNESLQQVLNNNNLSKRVKRRITPIRKNRFNEFESQSVEKMVHLNTHETCSGEALVNENEMD